MDDENSEVVAVKEISTEEEYLRNVFLEVNSSALEASLPALIYGSEAEGLKYELDSMINENEKTVDVEQDQGKYAVTEEEIEGSKETESSHKDEPDNKEEDKVEDNNTGTKKSQCQVKITPLSEMWATMKPYSGSSTFSKPWDEIRAKSEAASAQARGFRPRPYDLPFERNEGMSRINASTIRPNFRGRSSSPPVGRGREGQGRLPYQNSRNFMTESESRRLGVPGSTQIAAAELGFRPLQFGSGRPGGQREQAPAQFMQRGNMPVQGNQGSNNFGQGVPYGSFRGRFGGFKAERGRAAPPNVGFNGGFRMPVSDRHGNYNFGPPGRETAAPAASLNNFNPGGGRYEPSPRPNNFCSRVFVPQRSFGRESNWKTSSKKIPVSKPAAPVTEGKTAPAAPLSASHLENIPPVIPPGPAQGKPTPVDSSPAVPAAPVKSSISSTAPRKKGKNHRRDPKSSSDSASSPTSTDAPVTDEVFTASLPSKSEPSIVSLDGSTVAPTAKPVTQEQQSAVEGSADDAGSAPNPTPGLKPKKGNKKKPKRKQPAPAIMTVTPTAPAQAPAAPAQGTAAPAQAPAATTPAPAAPAPAPAQAPAATTPAPAPAPAATAQAPSETPAQVPAAQSDAPATAPPGPTDEKVPSSAPDSKTPAQPSNLSSKIFRQLDSRYQYRHYRCPEPACHKSWTMVTNGKIIECSFCHTKVQPWEDPALARLKGKPSSLSQFRCPLQECGNEWESVRAYIGYPQPCDHCGTITYAFRENPVPRHYNNY